MAKIVSEYDQEIPQSQTADNPDSEGERILQYALAYDLFLGNRVSKNVTVTSSHTGPVIQQPR